MVFKDWFFSPLTMPLRNASFPSLHSALPVRALGNLRYGRPLDSSQWEGSWDTAGTDHLHLLPRPHGPRGTKEEEETSLRFSPTRFLTLAPWLVLLLAPGLSCSHRFSRFSSLLDSGSLFRFILRLQWFHNRTLHPSKSVSVEQISWTGLVGTVQYFFNV